MQKFLLSPQVKGDRSKHTKQYLEHLRNKLVCKFQAGIGFFFKAIKKMITLI